MSRSAAYAAIYEALRRGRLIRPTKCPRCEMDPPIGDRGQIVKICFHHTHGYEAEHWLTGEWMCASCHSKTHSGTPIFTPEDDASIEDAMKEAKSLWWLVPGAMALKARKDREARQKEDVFKDNAAEGVAL